MLNHDLIKNKISQARADLPNYQVKANEKEAYMTEIKKLLKEEVEEKLLVPNSIMYPLKLIKKLKNWH